MRCAVPSMLLVLGFAAGSSLLGRPLLAHEGHHHTALGVVKAIAEAELELETTEGETQTFLLTQKTAFRRADTAVSQDEVEVGERAAVMYEETDGVKTALEVELGAAEESAAAEAGLRVVETRYVCMINDALFDRPQIPVEVEGKTYFGCCPMCKERLANDAAARTATDPLTGQPVDKATAVVAAYPDGRVLYFASVETLSRFAAAD